MHRVLRRVLSGSFVTFALMSVAAACSTAAPTVITPPAVCRDSVCVAGNVCVSGFDNAEDEQAADPKKQSVSCRLVCDLDPANKLDFDSNGVALRAPQDKCPSNFHCSPGGTTDVEAGSATVSYCVPDKVSIAFSPAMGQWGTPCNPRAATFDKNPACDQGNSFWCYAADANDGAAICTQFQCSTDFDCKGGYWCATVNQGPNAGTVKRTEGVETTVCLPRAWNVWPGSYCAPCKSDDDCPMNLGRPQHCVGADSKAGTEKVCAVECATDKNCNLDNKCVVPAENNVSARVCLPRAATCGTSVGAPNEAKGTADGTLCSPCRNDGDCANGVCATADYSTERFCTSKSSTPCSSTSSACPTKPSEAAAVSCYTQGALKDQCIGVVVFGNNGGTPVDVAGCWTPNRP